MCKYTILGSLSCLRCSQTHIYTLGNAQAVQVLLKQTAYVRTLILITFYKIIIIFDFHFKSSEREQIKRQNGAFVNVLESIIGWPTGGTHDFGMIRDVARTICRIFNKTAFNHIRTTLLSLSYRQKIAIEKRKKQSSCHCVAICDMK